MPGARDATVAQCANIRAAGAADALAAVFLGRASVEYQLVVLAERSKHVVAPDPHAFVTRYWLIWNWSGGRQFRGDQRTSLFGPARTRAVEHADFGVAAILECPPRIKAELHPVAIEHD